MGRILEVDNMRVEIPETGHEVMDRVRRLNTPENPAPGFVEYNEQLIALGSGAALWTIVPDYEGAGQFPGYLQHPLYTKRFFERLGYTDPEQIKLGIEARVGNAGLLLPNDKNPTRKVDQRYAISTEALRPSDAVSLEVLAIQIGHALSILDQNSHVSLQLVRPEDFDKAKVACMAIFPNGAPSHKGDSPEMYIYGEYNILPTERVGMVHHSHVMEIFHRTFAAAESAEATKERLRQTLQAIESSSDGF